MKNPATIRASSVRRHASKSARTANRGPRKPLAPPESEAHSSSEKDKEGEDPGRGRNDHRHCYQELGVRELLFAAHSLLLKRPAPVCFHGQEGPDDCQAQAQ